MIRFIVEGRGGGQVGWIYFIASLLHTISEPFLLIVPFISFCTLHFILLNVHSLYFLVSTQNNSILFYSGIR